MKKSFDAVKFMRKRRKQADDEDSGLDWMARRRKIRKLLAGDPLWENLMDRVTGDAGEQTRQNNDRAARTT
jgi:hypothetical protein